MKIYLLTDNTNNIQLKQYPSDSSTSVNKESRTTGPGVWTPWLSKTKSKFERLLLEIFSLKQKITQKKNTSNYYQKINFVFSRI